MHGMASTAAADAATMALVLLPPLRGPTCTNHGPGPRPGPRPSTLPHPHALLVGVQQGAGGQPVRQSLLTESQAPNKARESTPSVQ